MATLTQPFLIGIAGGTGSGKSTLARALLDRFSSAGACLIDLDSYYFDHSHLSPAQREAFNYDHPSAIDHETLVSDLARLARGEAIDKPCYSFATHCRLPQTKRVEPASVIIVEGLFVFYDEALRRLLDLKIYMDADADIRFIRRLRRDVIERARNLDSVVAQYLSTVRPMHLQYVEPTRAFADLVFSGSQPVTAMLAQVLERLAASRRVVDG